MSQPIWNFFTHSNFSSISFHLFIHIYVFSAAFFMSEKVEVVVVKRETKSYSEWIWKIKFFFFALDLRTDFNNKIVLEFQFENFHRFLEICFWHCRIPHSRSTTYISNFWYTKHKMRIKASRSDDVGRFSTNSILMEMYEIPCVGDSNGIFERIVIKTSK